MRNEWEYEFRLEDDIPVPPIRTLCMSRRSYPWHLMQPGQSFLVPCPIGDVARVMNSLTSCRKGAEKRFGGKFTMRRTSKGVRVWRTS